MGGEGVKEIRKRGRGKEKRKGGRGKGPARRRGGGKGASKGPASLVSYLCFPRVDTVRGVKARECTKELGHKHCTASDWGDDRSVGCQKRATIVRAVKGSRAKTNQPGGLRVHAWVAPIVNSVP